MPPLRAVQWAVDARVAGTAEAARDALLSVRVRTSVVQPVERRIVIQGRTEPARVVTLRAEVDGRIVALGAARGARVRHGELIARIDMRDRSR